MTTLNADARDAALALGDAVHAATDVTGFGLLGHLRELLVGSGLAADVDAERGAGDRRRPRRSLADGMVAGGTQRNHAFVDDSVDWNGLARDEQLLLADAQTSGGLLLAVAPDAVDALVRRSSTRAARCRRRSSVGPAAGDSRAPSRSGDDEHPELGFELRAGLGAERRALEATVAEQPDERDALHVVLLRQRAAPRRC